MMPGRIKAFWLVSLAMAVAAAIATAAVLWPRMEVSDLYRRYADAPGIDATFLHDFRVSDTVTVDVTILQATDSAGWERLRRDFNIATIPPEALPYIDTTTIAVKLAPKTNHALPQDSILLNNDYIVISRSRRNVLVFDIKEKEQLNAILFYKLQQLKNDKSNPIDNKKNTKTL